MFLARLGQTGYIRSLRKVPSRIRRNLSEHPIYAYLAVLGPGMIAANAGNSKISQPDINPYQIISPTRITKLMKESTKATITAALPC